jgi:hypothetical protein
MISFINILSVHSTSIISLSMNLIVVTCVATSLLSRVGTTSVLVDNPSHIGAFSRPVRPAVVPWLRNELELFLHFVEVSENSIRYLSGVVESMIASPGFSDNKLRIVSQAFDVIRKQYISGTLPDDKQVLLCAIISVVGQNLQVTQSARVPYLRWQCLIQISIEISRIVFTIYYLSFIII